MKKEYDKFIPVYAKIKNAVKKFPTAIVKQAIFDAAKSLDIDVRSEEELIDGLKIYFLKSKIVITESEVVKGGMEGKSVLRFEKISEEHEQYIPFFDIYKTLGQTLYKYIYKYYDYSIEINDIITYANKIISQDKDIKAPTGEIFIKGLDWYLSDMADLYMPPEAKIVGIEMEIKPLISIETGTRKGNIAIFREIR